jgi:hypothetical protein
MPWTAKRRYACYPIEDQHGGYRAPDTPFKPRGGRARLLLIAVIAVLSLFSAVHMPRAHADEIQQLEAAWIPIAHGSAQPTAAWSEFCERFPSECAVNPAERATIKLDQRVWKAIAAINSHVNATDPQAPPAGRGRLAAPSASHGRGAGRTGAGSCRASRPNRSGRLHPRQQARCRPAVASDRIRLHQERRRQEPRLGHARQSGRRHVSGRSVTRMPRQVLP